MRLTRSIVHALAALLVLTAQLGGAVHLAAVQHTVCAEHGEIVDVPHATATASTHDVELSASAVHAHEHCGIDALFSPRGALLSRASLWIVRSAPYRVALGRHVDPPSSIALLHLAPKSSPPRFA